jgi:hypothetical protein
MVFPCAATSIGKVGVGSSHALVRGTNAASTRLWRHLPMDPHVQTAPDGIYRTPGRVSPPPRLPPPSWPTLLRPLRNTAMLAALVGVSVAFFQAIAPALLGTSDRVRLIPSIGMLEDALMLALPLTLVVLVVLVVRRVRPSWGGLRMRARLLYVTALLLAQSGVVVAAEAGIFSSRGGLRLFGPSHLASTWLPDGRTAHVYTRAGLACGYEVFVSSPLSLTATSRLELSRATCMEPRPTVHANPDGTIELRDSAGHPLEAQPSPTFSFFHGC